MSFERVKITPLGEIATIKGGKRLPKGSNLIAIRNNHPYIKVKDMKNDKTIKLNNDFEFIEQEAQKKISKYIVNNNDLILSIVGTIGLVSKIDISLDKANLTENCVKLTNLKNLDTDYLYYYLTSPAGKVEMDKGTVGSTQPKLPIYNIKKLPIPLVSLKEQKKIATILSILDEKIEVNNQINDTLENIAQELFKRWFVDFEFPDENGEPYQSSGGEMVDSDLGVIPKGWEVKKLDNIIELHDSKRIPLAKNERSKRDNVYPYYGAAALMDYVDDYIFEGTYILLGEDGTVITTEQKPVLQYVWGKFWVNNHAHVISTKSEISINFLYLLLNNLNVGSAVTGAVQLKINQKNLKSLKIVLPNKMSLIQKFSETINDNFNYKKVLEDENRSLKQTRDTLLPKLMSGELRVSLEKTEDITAEMKGG